MTKEKIVVFSGNRAEYGIMFPIIQHIGKYYSVDIILSGAHVLMRWNTSKAVKEQLEQSKVKCNVIEIPLHDDENVYIACLGEIYVSVCEYFRKTEDVGLAIVLGDRIETVGFALGAFYSKIPLVHISGGDIVDVLNYDTYVRHSISKIASYHFVTNEDSRRNLLQLGEEEERIFNIGNPSFDYDRIGLLPSYDTIAKEYGLFYDDTVAVYTFHPLCAKDKAENLKEFMEGIEGLKLSKIAKIIVTYPNNDPGFELILEYIENHNNDDRFCFVNSLGTYNYLAIMKNCRTIVVGNSSSGLLETAFYCVPVLNVGERQRGRIRGCNVEDVLADRRIIKEAINNIIEKYDNYLQKNEKDKYYFGDGTAAIKAYAYIEQIFEKNMKERLYKKFIVR